ncbi:hypothetical protein THAOC_21591, partial [Thalassiosira oceanica]
MRGGWRLDRGEGRRPPSSRSFPGRNRPGERSPSRPGERDDGEEGFDRFVAGGRSSVALSYLADLGGGGTKPASPEMRPQGRPTRGAATRAGAARPSNARDLPRSPIADGRSLSPFISETVPVK